jgi:hypothetical protein
MHDSTQKGHLAHQRNSVFLVTARKAFTAKVEEQYFAEFVASDVSPFDREPNSQFSTEWTQGRCD